MKVKSSISVNDDDNADRSSNQSQNLADIKSKSLKGTNGYELIGKLAVSTDDEKDLIAMTSSTGEDDEKILSESTTPLK